MLQNDFFVRIMHQGVKKSRDGLGGMDVHGDLSARPLNELINKLNISLSALALSGDVNALKVPFDWVNVVKSN